MPGYADARKNEDDHSNIFSRLSEHDKDIAQLKEGKRNTERMLENIDKKLNSILEKI